MKLDSLIVHAYIVGIEVVEVIVVTRINASELNNSSQRRKIDMNSSDMYFTDRARVIYCQPFSMECEIGQEPSRYNSSAIRDESSQRRHVELCNTNTTLAAYRFMKNGKPNRFTKYPKCILRGEA